MRDFSEFLVDFIKLALIMASSAGMVLGVMAIAEAFK